LTIQRHAQADISITSYINDMAGLDQPLAQKFRSLTVILDHKNVHLQIFLLSRKPEKDNTCMDLASLIAQYGYLAVLVGCLLEGETVLLLAGYAAHRGYLDPALVWLVAWFAASVGDLFFFWLGRRHGQDIVAKRPALGAKINRSLGLIEHHPAKIIMVMRFLYGLRIALPIALGVSNVSWRLYAMLNIISAAIWAALITGLGYVFGALLSQWLGKIHAYEHWVVLGLIALVVLIHILLRYRTRSGP
jgi:membrane protein DedA with SNARE-associated domain